MSQCLADNGDRDIIVSCRRCPGMAGDIEGKLALEVHRQHPLCPFHPEALHQGFGYSRRNPIHPAALVHGYGCMRIWHVWCGLDARWSQLLGWTSAHALPVYDRNAAVPCFPSHPVQGKGCVLDQFHHSSPALPRTLYREHGWRQ